jgi:hypothetical protein
MEYRRYDSGYYYPKIVEPSASMEIMWEITEKNSLKLNLYRMIHDSDLYNALIFASKSFDISLISNPTGNLQFRWTILYGKNDYIGFDFNSRIFEINGEIRYKFHKLGDIVFTYSHERWKSNASTPMSYNYPKHTMDLSYMVKF